MPPTRRDTPRALLSAMANKRERQATIRGIIDSRPIENQEELRKQLRQRGWDVTQSTLSRDLRAMRVSRIPYQGGSSRCPEARSRSASPWTPKSGPR